MADNLTATVQMWWSCRIGLAEWWRFSNRLMCITSWGWECLLLSLTVCIYRGFTPLTAGHSKFITLQGSFLLFSDTSEVFWIVKQHVSLFLGAGATCNVPDKCFRLADGLFQLASAWLQGFLRFQCAVVFFTVTVSGFHAAADRWKVALKLYLCKGH